MGASAFQLNDVFAANDNFIRAANANGAVTYVHTDKQNSVIALTNATGNPISRRGYGEYGQTSATQMAEFGHPFGYTGRRYEADLGLYYYRARWYDPELGTFLETDPIGAADYINLYSYVGLNPMGKTDPSGTQSSGTVTVTHRTITYDGIPIRSIFLVTQMVNMFGKEIQITYPVTPSHRLVREAFPGIANNEPSDARDPDGAKAPGLPGIDDGYEPPRGGPQWVKNPNGQGGGWKDKDGNVWVPTGPRPDRAHGGPHWDVQRPGGRSGGNVYPGGRVRPRGNR